MSTAAVVVETVTINRPMFERIEQQRKSVADNESRLNKATEAHKYAKKQHDASRDTLDALVSEMIRVVNGGQSDLPLFDNMNAAIERAESNPIAQALLTRLLDHHYTGLNLLIVAGYSEAEQAEIAAYLDSLDVRDKAHADSLEDSSISVPDALPEPAMLAKDAIDAKRAALDEQFPVPTVEAVTAALEANALGWVTAYAHLSDEQRRAVVAWAQACEAVRTEKGEAVVFDDLPVAPSYILNPSELLPNEAETPAEPEAEAPKKPRAKRRSSANFKNSPRQVKGKKGKK